MSEQFSVNEVRDLPSIQFRSAGVVYDPNPDPTATLVLPDNTTSSLTLSKQGSGTSTRWLVEDFTYASEAQLEVRYATADTAADIAEWVEYVSVRATADVTVDLTPITDVTDKFHFTGSLGSEKVNSFISASDVLDVLATDHDTPGTIGGVINTPAADVDLDEVLEQLEAIRAGTDQIGAGPVFVRAPVDSEGNAFIKQGTAYTGNYRLHYTSTDTRNLLASGTVVKLQFGSWSFTASEVTGMAGAWHLYFALTSEDTNKLARTTYVGELAVFESTVEVPGLGSTTVFVEGNP